MKDEGHKDSQYTSPRCSNITANISRLSYNAYLFISLYFMCWKVIWYVHYSHLEELALLQWLERSCPLCLTVAKAFFGCRTRSLTTARNLGSERLPFFKLHAEIIEKDTGRSPHLYQNLPECSLNGVTQYTCNIHCMFCTAAVDASGRMHWSLLMAGSESGSFAPVEVDEEAVGSWGSSLYVKDILSSSLQLSTSLGAWCSRR